MRDDSESAFGCLCELHTEHSQALGRALIAAAGLAQFANLFYGIIDLHLENAFAEQRRGFRRIPDVALAIA